MGREFAGRPVMQKILSSLARAEAADGTPGRRAGDRAREPGARAVRLHDPVRPGRGRAPGGAAWQLPPGRAAAGRPADPRAAVGRAESEGPGWRSEEHTS